MNMYNYIHGKLNVFSSCWPGLGQQPLKTWTMKERRGSRRGDGAAGEAALVFGSPRLNIGCPCLSFSLANGEYQ